MYFKDRFENLVVGDFVDEVPLVGVGGEVGVPGLEVVVGRPGEFFGDVEEVVGGVGEEALELDAEGGGACSMAAAGVA